MTLSQLTGNIGTHAPGVPSLVSRQLPLRHARGVRTGALPRIVPVKIDSVFGEATTLESKRPISTNPLGAGWMPQRWRELALSRSGNLARRLFEPSPRSNSRKNLGNSEGCSLNFRQKKSKPT